MIWVYISIATVIAFLLCKDKLKRPEYFILALFPIELYGINVATITIKPYMLYGVVIVFLYFLRKKSFYINRIIIVFLILLVFSNLLTGLISTSIMQHAMFLINMIIVSIVLAFDENGVDINSISEVAIATLIGHGIVFLILAVLFNAGVSVPDMLSDGRTETGIYIVLSNATEESIRMRGFTIDPNGFVANYFLAGSCALWQATRNRRNRIKNLLAVALFLFIIIQSGSRMSLLCFAVLVVLVTVYNIKIDNVNRNAFIIANLVVLLGTICFVVYYREISGFITSFFSGRAGLFSNAGRFTIWISNFKYLVRTDKIWLGLGQDQIAQLGDLNTAFHNTWLEWIAGCGLFIGGFISLWFLRIAVKTVGKLRIYKRRIPDVIPMGLGYICTVICMSSVSNIANITCLFLAFLLSYHLSYSISTEDKNELKNENKEQQVSV